jgi:hypothetical protein
MDKMSNVEVGQVLKLSAGTIRALSEENQNLKTKVSHFEKRAQAEKIATAMEDKRLQPELDYKQKVAGLMERDDLEVVEQAVGLTAPQMKLASVAEDSTVEVEGSATSDDESGRAAQTFFQNLVTGD